MGEQSDLDYSIRMHNHGSLVDNSITRGIERIIIIAYGLDVYSKLYSSYLHLMHNKYLKGFLVETI